MQKLLKLLDKLESHVLHARVLNSAISKADIAWHIEHSCLVIIKIIETIQKSHPSKFESKFSLKKSIVFLTGNFPRGAAKAPSSVLPSENVSTEHLTESIAKARASVHALLNCEKNQYFLHPIFGNLNSLQTFRFLAIHTNHHLKIINDILQ